MPRSNESRNFSEPERRFLDIRARSTILVFPFLLVHVFPCPVLRRLCSCKLPHFSTEYQPDERAADAHVSAKKKKKKANIIMQTQCETEKSNQQSS